MDRCKLGSPWLREKVYKGVKTGRQGNRRLHGCRVVRVRGRECPRCKRQLYEVVKGYVEEEL